MGDIVAAETELPGIPIEDRPSSPTAIVRRRALTIGLVLVVTLAAFEALAVATILPSARRDLGGVRLYGWAFSAFLLMSLVGIIWAGQQSDRHGPARPFLAGTALFGVGLVVAGLAPAMWVLIAGRSIQGLGAGVIPAVAYVAIGRAYSESERPRMFAILSTAWVVPGLIGPAVAAVAAEASSWRVVFLGLVPLLVVAVVLAAPALRRLGPPGTSAVTEGRPRVVDAVRLASGAAFVLAGLTAANVWLTGPLVLGGILWAAPALKRLLPHGTLKAARGLPAAIAGMGLLNFAFFGADAYIPYALTEIRGQSTFVVGAVLTATTITWTAGSWTVERLANRVARPAIMAVGMLIIVAGLAGVTATIVTDVPIFIAIVAWGIGGFGMGLAYPSFSLTVLTHTTSGSEGATTSALKLFETLGGALGTGLGGAIVAAGAAADRDRPAITALFAFMAGVALVGIVAARRSASSLDSGSSH